jgi:hypothetical protein
MGDGSNRISLSRPVSDKCQLQALAGAVGFEPTVHGTKTRCLTTWLRPNVQVTFQPPRILHTFRLTCYFSLAKSQTGRCLGL